MVGRVSVVHFVNAASRRSKDVIIPYAEHELLRDGLDYTCTAEGRIVSSSAATQRR